MLDAPWFDRDDGHRSPDRGVAAHSGDADRGSVTPRGSVARSVAISAAIAVFLLVPNGNARSVGCGSGAHGSPGYAYAGHESARVASGIRATITALHQPSVNAGHAAGWIGLGGKGAGPNGETMWLQAGIAALPRTPLTIYVEVTRPDRDPVFIPLLSHVEVGEKHRLAVLEMNRRPGVWRVWLDESPVTDPIVLPGSHKRWRPIVTAESWNGGVSTCNGFRFRFERVGVAQALGGSWRTFVPGFTFRDQGFVVRQLRPAPAGTRKLAFDSITPYAFDAQSR